MTMAHARRSFIDLGCTGYAHWLAGCVPRTYLLKGTWGLMSIVYPRRLFLLLLCWMTSMLSAAPLPWLAFDLADSRESMLRRAKQKNVDWVDELSRIIILEQNDNGVQAAQAYEELITQQSTNDTALAILLPLYWRLMETLESVEQRAHFFLNLSEIPETGSIFRILLLEPLLGFKAQYLLPDLETSGEPSIEVLQSEYERLLGLLASNQNHPAPLKHWIASLLYRHMSGDGLAYADQYLLQEKHTLYLVESLQPSMESLQPLDDDEQAFLAGLLTVYRKILYEQQGLELPMSSASGSWLLPGASAAMPIPQIIEKQHEAYQLFQSEAASTISAAWLLLSNAANCFNKIHSNPKGSNPKGFRLRSCQESLDSAHQCLFILKYLLSVQWPWRGKEEWETGDREYKRLVLEYDKVLALKKQIANSLAQDGSADVQNIQMPPHQFAQPLQNMQSVSVSAKNQTSTQAFERFKAHQQTLIAQIQQAPNNETLISQYLSLIDDQDAHTGLTAESRANIRAAAVKWLEQAQNNNRMDRLYESYRQQVASLHKRFYDDPIATAEALIALVNSEAGESLAAEERQALRNFLQLELKALKAEQETREKKSHYYQKPDKLNQQQQKTSEPVTYVLKQTPAPSSNLDDFDVDWEDIDMD